MTTQTFTKWEGLDFEELRTLSLAELRVAFDPERELFYCEHGHPLVAWNVTRRRGAPLVCVICQRRHITSGPPKVCNAGHEISGTNMHVYRGVAYCEKCRKASQKRWNEKRRARKRALRAGEEVPVRRKITHEELLAHRREQAARRRAKKVALQQTLREERLRAASDPS